MEREPLDVQPMGGSLPGFGGWPLISSASHRGPNATHLATRSEKCRPARTARSITLKKFNKRRKLTNEALPYQVPRFLENGRSPPSDHGTPPPEP